jgi:hypothetical protein
MQNLDDKSIEDLMKSILAESAKARNELKCAEGDLQKAQNRLSFILILVNELLNRKS